MAAIIKQYDKRIGVTYAYESISYWDKEKKQSRSKRRLLGIVNPITGEIKPTTRKKRGTLTDAADSRNGARHTLTPMEML